MSQSAVMSVALIPALIPVGAIMGAAKLCQAGFICINKLIEYGIDPKHLKRLDSISQRRRELEKAFRGSLVLLAQTQAHTLHSPGDRADRLSRLTAMQQAINQVHLFKAAIEKQNPGRLELLGQDLHTLASRANNPPKSKLLDAAQQELTGLITRAEATLKRIENETGHEVLSLAMSNLGYDREQLGHKLRFTRQKQVIFAELDDHGVLKLEAAGFMGNDCADAMHEIRSELSRLGLATKVQSVTPHGAVQNTQQAIEPQHFFNEMLFRNFDDLHQQEEQLIQVRGG